MQEKIFLSKDVVLTLQIKEQDGIRLYFYPSIGWVPKERLLQHDILTEKNILSLCMTLKIVIIATYVQKTVISMELIHVDSKIAGLIAIVIRGKRNPNVLRVSKMLGYSITVVVHNG